MSDIIYFFETAGPTATIMSVLAFLFAAQRVVAVVEYFAHKIGFKTRGALEKDGHVNMLISHDGKLLIMEGEFTTMRKELHNYNEKLNVVSQMIVDMQNRADTKDRARLKDRIGQAYRYHSTTKKWTPMDQEAFKDLIRSYEEAGGNNSFVHEKCEPESLTWEIIND